MNEKDFILNEIYLLLVIFFKNWKRIDIEKNNEENMAKAYINMISELPIDQLISYRDYLAKSIENSSKKLKNMNKDGIVTKKLDESKFNKWLRR